MTRTGSSHSNCDSVAQSVNCRVVSCNCLPFVGASGCLSVIFTEGCGLLVRAKGSHWWSVPNCTGP